MRNTLISPHNTPPSKKKKKKKKKLSCQKVCDALYYLLGNILALNFIDKLQAFEWLIIVLHVLQICFCVLL